MFRRTMQPIVPTRTVWADKTQVVLNDIRKRRAELDDEERIAKDLCNHTYPSGESALETVYDEDPYGPDTGPFTRCDVCGR